MNVAELSIQGLEEFGEYESLYFGGRWYTNREMLTRSRQIAAGLTELGVKQGDRVAMVLANCPEVLNAFNGCFIMGAWCMPVMFTLTGEEMGFIFGDAEPSVVITQRLFLDKVEEARRRVPSIKSVVIIDPEPVPGADFMPDWFKELPDDFETVSCEPDEVALMMYTSGTTGAPKGVMISHDNLHFTAINSSKARGIEPGEITVSCLPLNHSYGIILWASSESFGIKNVLLPRFDPAELLQTLEDFKAGATALVPTMMIRMLALTDTDKYDLSNMRRWSSAAAPLQAEVRKQFVARFHGKLVESYGLTECSPTVTISRLDREIKDGAVGQPIDGVEVSIKDEAGNILAPGEVGEICVSGRNVMKGYYNRPEANAEIIRDGWLHTGDVGRMDEDGYLYITDRVRDLIIRGGENIFPKDIEEVLIRHPQVEEVAVIGMPHEEYGEEVMAVVVPVAGTEPSADDIIAFCRGRLGKFQIPRRVEFMSDLPRTGIGKILKRELRKQYFQK
jgi:long-chain acyl-CoA synthetase